MPRLTIDGREVEVTAGTTLLDAARALGIAIPTLCHWPGVERFTSCFVCVVRINGGRRLLPACATVAADGMTVDASSAEVIEARRTALELLLGDHLGDCLAPCHLTCPAHLNIPRMIRQIAAGDMSGALATVKEDIALPAVLGRICAAPCERACRRAAHDGALSIMSLKRFVADFDLASGAPFAPSLAAPSGSRVAIVGAGPTGLAAAFHLRRLGHDCTVFDECAAPGGMLRVGVTPERLPRDVLDAEIDTIRRLGVDFRCATRVGGDVAFAELRRDYAAVILALGQRGAARAPAFGLDTTDRGIHAVPRTHATALAGVFAGGDACVSARMTVHAVTAGKGMAHAADQYMRGVEVTGVQRPFSSRTGTVTAEALASYLVEGSAAARGEPRAGVAGGFSAKEAATEAGRCLHCDCRKADSCRLRAPAWRHAPRQARFSGPEEKRFEQIRQPGGIVYEPGKCIRCGLCVRLTRQAGERLGLTFVGRGFTVRVAVPFAEGLEAGLERAGAACVEACPTGALATI